MCTFLGLGDSAVFQYMLCLFVSGLYWKTQVSSSVMICLRISILSLVFSSMSSQNLTRFYFWSSGKILGIILAHALCIPRLCSKIVHTDSLFRLSSSDIIHTINLRSVHTSCFTLVMFSSVLVVERRPIVGSSSTSSWPFSKRLCHSKIWVLDITSSP